ncbi:hypothetical protein HPB50_022104 [Hyalomma asiaticum]|uniref:Uncharacterized protein n=1 Tax=Hyalomma asiaticum TaxID=266040 RepID=A0ACB7TP35_HYAAI|nr:hypothetical protein HPB50_022104 [Hyalomma asiaticum]
MKTACDLSTSIAVALARGYYDVASSAPSTYRQQRQLQEDALQEDNAAYHNTIAETVRSANAAEGGLQHGEACGQSPRRFSGTQTSVGAGWPHLKQPLASILQVSACAIRASSKVFDLADVFGIDVINRPVKEDPMLMQYVYVML